jgi:hypothetical protein
MRFDPQMVGRMVGTGGSGDERTTFDRTREVAGSRNDRPPLPTKEERSVREVSERRKAHTSRWFRATTLNDRRAEDYVPGKYFSRNSWPAFAAVAGAITSSRTARC